eukprot:564157-Prorocentrum_minimum.AAC.3
MPFWGPFRPNLTDFGVKTPQFLPNFQKCAGGPVDVTPPTTVVHSGPRRLTASRNATFILSAAGEDTEAYGYGRYTSVTLVSPPRHATFVVPAAREKHIQNYTNKI